MKFTNPTWQSLQATALEILDTALDQYRRSKDLATEAFLDSPPRMESRYDTRKEDEGAALGLIKCGTDQTILLREAIVTIDPSKLTPGKAQLGSFIIYESNARPAEQECALLWKEGFSDLDEHDFHILGVKTPMGQLFMNVREGDTFSVFDEETISVLQVVP